MKHFVTHTLRFNLEKVLAQSLMNCHVRGLHSIMLVDMPGQRIRLFVTTSEHELWQNTGQTLGSLAAHPHHCPITLHCTSRGFTNLTYGQDKEGKYFPFTYQSAILSGKGDFKATLALPVSLRGVEQVFAGDSITLAAESIHSVHVGKGVKAAWLVYEAPDNAAYYPLSYSDQDLHKISFEGLYQPMNEQQLRELLSIANLL